MVQKYHVEWIENINANGKSWKKMSLKDETGAMVTDVSVWPDCPTYPEITLGVDILGGIVTNAKGYKNFVINAAKPYTKSAPRTKDIEAAQERKSEMVKEAQENKQTGVEVSATFRDATQVALAQLSGKSFSDDEFKDCWLKWRGWLGANFDPDKSKRELGF